MSTLSDSSQDHLGWVYPLPPQTEITAVEAFVGVISGMTALTEDQDYVDVTFGTEQPTEDWVLLEAGVLNTADVAPLNLWVGIVTEKTVSGFRVYLNGLPDSANYFLSWSIRGAFGYYFSGPSSGTVGAASSAFTVRLPDESTMTGTVVITPDDGSAGGTFAPTTVELTLEEPSATFTYTASTYGARSISVSNDRGLVNPAQISYTVATPTYAFSGPSTGESGSPSTDFTVTLSGTVVGTITVTPSDGGDGGTFTPTTATLSTGAPVDTFTYTPDSVGTKTISVTNNGGLANPANLSYAATTPAFDPDSVTGLVLWLKADSLSLSDGDPVSTWADSSGSGHTATGTTTTRPLYKTNIVNSKPALLFDGTDDFLTVTSEISLPANFTLFVVYQTSGDGCMVGAASMNCQFRIGESTAAGGLSFFDGAAAYYSDALSTARASWNEVTFYRTGGTMYYYEGVTARGNSPGASTASKVGMIGKLGTPDALKTTGYIAEVLVYDNAISFPNHTLLVGYLRDKYGL